MDLAVAHPSMGVIAALAPAFAAGFAVQQLLELADPVLDKIPKDQKKPVLSFIALGIGLALSVGAHLHILQPLGVRVGAGWDAAVTGVFISGGTQGFNSIMKFLGYAKERKKAEVVHQRKQTTGRDEHHLNRLAPIDRV